jgi:Na+-translocating ferredoxin:NAD+ oxidoreductase subunit E
LIPNYKGYLLMILPPGGFLALGFLLAGKRVLDRRLAARAAAAAEPVPA